VLRQGIGFVLLLLVLWSGQSHGQSPRYVVITHPSAQATSININELRRIFAARQQVWTYGGKITVVMQDHNSDAHSRFCRQYLNLFPYQIERLWNQLVYSGQAEAPIITGGDAITLDIVSRTPGAIAYVDGATALPEAVRRVVVDGAGG
jgi:ABC-type phosphate transport system substrate-binding protein